MGSQILCWRGAKNKTLGVVGFGRIGVEVAYRAKGQRMNVMAYDPFLTDERAKELGVTKATVEEICAAADSLQFIHHFYLKLATLLIKINLR